ncbi:hypothetical protein EJ110_NYTH10536 [Nymphaea thermarum]|nr:hypothetical protein EJ110_NYTH10536 [Nymphaea thermarum]
MDMLPELLLEVRVGKRPHEGGGVEGAEGERGEEMGSKAHSWRWRWASPVDLRWPEFLRFSMVDDLLWLVVTMVESVALASLLCFFFLFCGCSF